MSQNNFRGNLLYAAICLITAAILTCFTAFDETHADYMGKLARHYDSYATQTAAASPESFFTGI